MKIIETHSYKKIKQAQDMPPPGGQPPPQIPKKKKKRIPLDEPVQFDNSSKAPKEDNFINPVRRSI